jgi:hypothetical protein
MVLTCGNPDWGFCRQSTNSWSGLDHLVSEGGLTSYVHARHQRRVGSRRLTMIACSGWTTVGVWLLAVIASTVSCVLCACVAWRRFKANRAGWRTHNAVSQRDDRGRCTTPLAGVLPRVVVDREGSGPGSAVIGQGVAGEVDGRQKLVVGQDTELSELIPSTVTGADQVPVAGLAAIAGSPAEAPVIATAKTSAQPRAEYSMADHPAERRQACASCPEPPPTNPPAAAWPGHCRATHAPR